jgi:hydroxymethylglutaryl-CoA reductase (NADPH)
LATVLALAGRVSASHPIHTLLLTSLCAAVAYLAVVQQYMNEGFSYDEPTAMLYYHPPQADLPWVAIDDTSRIPVDVSHYNVVPFQFSRVGEHALPEIEGAISQGDLTFVVSQSDDAERLKQLTAEDGTVWHSRSYHAKLGKYSDMVISGFDKVLKLIQGAETFDIAIVTSAYIAMFYTLFSLFVRMRSVGSKFWLGFSTIVSSFFAFLMALYTTTRYLELPIPFLSLSEGVPFIVAVVGFNHKVLLAQKVLQNYTDKEYLKHGSPTVLYTALKDQGASFLRDYLLIITAFLGCSVYASHLEGLKNFCIFAALILAFDIFTTATFLSSILSLKLEINLIHRSTLLKEALEEDGLTEDTVDDVLRASQLKSTPSFTDAPSTHVTIAKVIGISIFIGLHLYGLGSAWLSDLNSTSEYSYSNALSDSIVSNIPIGSKGTLVTLYPTRFFLPEKLSTQVENVILSSISFFSVAIRDRYISKFVLFAFAISASINIYLLNVARIHTTSFEEVIELKKPKKKTAKAVELPKPVESKDQETFKSSEILASSDSESEQHPRPLEQVVELYKDGKVKSLIDEEVVTLVTSGKLPLYALEKQLGDNLRAVAVRRKAIAELADAPVLRTSKLPYLHYDYDRVFGACCENVIGFVPIPVGVAGPLIIDGKPYHIPMATTEGCLVASAMRGCKAINIGGGVTTVLTKDGMTRGPCVKFPGLKRAGQCKLWLDSEEGQDVIKKAFNSTSRFARLQHLQTALAGDLLFIRFRTTTGDAMGMNMISKGVEFALKQMIEEYGWDDMSVVSVSGNYCTDKKPAAVNWIEGRGKSVVAEAVIPKDTVVKVLKSDVKALVEVNVNKNLIGSAMAGSVGGFNAQAANMLTAVYLALGQDPAQNVESSNCITLMSETVEGDLKISVSMPSIEVGTIGGGTILDPQGAMLELLGVRGPADIPGENARQLAKIIASIVLSGELSLVSALAAGHLVQSHMQHNRAAAKK